METILRGDINIPIILEFESEDITFGNNGFSTTAVSLLHCDRYLVRVVTFDGKLTVCGFGIKTGANDRKG